MSALVDRLRYAQAVPAGDGHANGGDSGPVGHANPMRPTPNPNVGPTQYAGPAAASTPPDAGLVVREGLGRAQLHRIAMGVSVEQAETPALDGRHNEIINRPHVASLEAMHPFGDTRPVMFRVVPDAVPGVPSVCTGKD